MAKDDLSGKLVVILHADVIGSTQLVQQNEQLAHERIQDAFRRFSDAIGKYHGRVQELRGDALLAEFERASDAVTAALAFQSDHDDHLVMFNDNIQPKIRVGIALGEVVIADNTVTGAGVVLAQRIEQLAEPGGLCITSAIHEALPNRMPFSMESLGEQTLKGFDEPVRVYRVQLRTGESAPPPQQKSSRKVSPNNLRQMIIFAGVVVLIAAGIGYWSKYSLPKEEQASIEDLALPHPDKPSIAVLPFSNMSNDSSQRYFSDGISEDIITDLSQLQNLIVIARNSSFTYRETSVNVQKIGQELGVKYLLEGSVRKAGDQIRVTAQLVDTSNGHQIWAERFDRQLTNIFVVQDEITNKIVSSLSIHITGDEQQQLAYHATNNFEAYDLFLQGQIFGARYTEEDLSQAIELYRQAIDLDPSFARAYGALATALTRLVFGGYSKSPAEMKERALGLARKAVSKNPNSPQTQWALGYVYMYQNQFDDAVAALERAISLSPSYADGYTLLALIKNNQGHAEEAIRLIEKGMAINPHYSWDYLYNLGRAHYALAHYQKAEDYLQQALSRNGTASGPRLFLVASHVRLGQLEEAEWEVMQLEISNPNATLQQVLQVLPITNTELRNKLLDDLRSAGLSE